MRYDVVVVGGGIAGLTSAAYLSKYGYKVLLCEQQNKVGGLVNSFSRHGFVFDGGIRAIENSGILFPMLRQLGIQMDFLRNDVSLIVGQQRLLLQEKEFAESYPAFLTSLFPAEAEAIQQLTDKICTSMEYMEVLYGFDNPLFMDWKENPAYARSLLPWMVKYTRTIGKIEALSQPIEEYLAQFIADPVLIDVFAQHFFKKTPAFFALSYFGLYMDYHYPVGGTGRLVQELADVFAKQKGELRLECPIQSINSETRCLRDAQGNEYNYQKLVWAADSKQLYRKLDWPAMENTRLKQSLSQYNTNLQNKTGSDSLFTVYLTTTIPPHSLFAYMSPHVFYTPQLRGLSSQILAEAKQKAMQNETIIGTKDDLFRWAQLYLEASTFEISCPAMRDVSLAPAGQSAFIISCLFDYGIMRQMDEQGYYPEFKQHCETIICRLVLETLLADFPHCKIESFSSSPLTIQRLTGNTDGAVTGWSFQNQTLPAVTKMSKIGSSIKTKLPHVYQAGQWTFSPSGLPVAVLSGKLAADRVKKELH